MRSVWVRQRLPCLLRPLSKEQPGAATQVELCPPEVWQRPRPSHATLSGRASPGVLLDPKWLLGVCDRSGESSRVSA